MERKITVRVRLERTGQATLLEVDETRPVKDVARELADELGLVGHYGLCRPGSGRNYAGGALIRDVFTATELELVDLSLREAA